MISSSTIAPRPEGLTQAELFGALDAALADATQLRKVLLVVPDFTRYHSDAGRIAAHYYDRLKDTCRVDLLVALGTHAMITPEQCQIMYPGIPYDAFIAHDWRNDVVKIGEVPGAFVREVSEGLVDTPIAVEVNRRVLDPSYDLVLSIGQVVPHEVVGMANRNKNLFVGCGGANMINASHMLGAFYGLERLIGKDFSPVRRVFDYAEAHFLTDVPLSYVLTVNTAPENQIRVHGLFIGRERKYFEEAVRLSQEKNITFLPPVEKMVVYLDPNEFKSTWLGNKAVYRTRMAIADEGELIVLAPGVETFGEDAALDGLLRKYGYCGRENVLRLVEAHPDLRENLSAAAHLIHGSSDGRFRITYCTKLLNEREVRGAGYAYQPYDEAARRYDPAALRPGENTLADGETVYYIPNPALGLWACREKFGA